MKTADEGGCEDLIAFEFLILFLPMAIQTPVVYRRPAKGPCIFCRRENVPFTEEDLPPVSIVGRRCYVLVDWVCGHCNNEFSVEDKYFGTNYHGSAGRVFYSIVGRKGRGAEVALKNFWAKFQPKINTVQFRIKTQEIKDQLLKEFSSLDNRQATTLELDTRTVNTRRLGRCLAKMAVETVACVKPEIVLCSELDDLRDYARGRGKIKFLPFALGVSKGINGAAIWTPDSAERSYPPVVLIWIPASLYAIQLFDFDDLRPLRTVAESNGLLLDDTGKRTENLGLNTTLEFAPTAQ